MKKKVIALLTAFVLLVSLTSCSSAPMDVMVATNDGFYTDYAKSSFAPAGMPAMEAYGEEAMDYSSEPNEEAEPVDTSRKLIRTVDISAETLDFDSTVANITKEVKKLKGYIESSNISDGGYYSYQYSMRNAYYTLRIPADKLDTFLEAIGDELHTTNISENQEDITLSYVDTEARVASLTVEYERLLELLGQAENVDTIVMLENRLSEVRYQLESYKSKIRVYDNKVEYSTVYLDISEVQRETSDAPETLGEKISIRFSDNTYALRMGLENLVVFFIGGIPYLLVISLIGCGLYIVIKHLIKRIKKKKEVPAVNEERK